MRLRLRLMEHTCHLLLLVSTYRLCTLRTRKLSLANLLRRCDSMIVMRNSSVNALVSANNRISLMPHSIYNYRRRLRTRSM
ncbi:hypothetical protein PF005_g24012 [Phytophthora fragariae]|uniref:Secreted protein n=2 Tax=Phytophthora TaxID=4783 RepID=A0A6A3WA24_9STRA|nr:hypothetical protein PF003_g18136 [Phytophthora fragariae]KAE8976254.1 hypothetical protein PR002_g25365 [Phytophthora rubi]KAE9015517.1 hypothetical protein PR001_g14880 [Phytophthora rubi]KAE9104713.1 hypothetical protein PF007_g13961 [Phytophthora fragariae]KAE9178608.1 hypothetical protein PF005_g24012 [Phytophthora fragariae]